jgi:glycosyltransferase involved in cell wall biosynthesis
LKIAVVIPAYDEAATIREVVSQARALAETVIVVDDGSRDGTSAKLEGLDVLVLRHEQNRGKADTLWTGFARAIELGADIVVTLDGDGQHRAEDIPRLVAAYEQHPERIVIGSRLHDRSNFPARRYYANCFARFWISWAAGYPIADTQTGFRIYPVRLLEQLERAHFHGVGFVFESEVLIRAARCGISAVAVPIPGIYPKAARASHFRPVLDILLIVRMVAGHLLRRGMFPMGLWRSLGRAEIIAADPLRGSTAD